MIPFKRVVLSRPCIAALVGLGLSVTNLSAAVSTWNGPATVDPGNIWSGPNWTPLAPATTDDVKFYDTGGVPAVSNINNTVDATMTIGSLQYGNTNGFHTTLITNGATLNITGAGGLTVGTLTDNGNAQIVNATVTGSGTLNLNNSSAPILVDQGRSANGNGTQRGILDLSGLSTFTATISRVAVGDATLGGSVNAQNATGTLKLGQTNVIRTSFIGTPIAANTVSTPTNAIEVGSDNGNSGGADFLFLGQSNAFYIDSIGVGLLKTTASMLFNTGLSSPIAYFRGTNGDSSRIRFWTVGDMSSSGSSSANANGTNDFRGGTVDIMVDTMSLGRDRQGGNTGASVTRGTFIFNAGTVDVNTLLLGNQAFTNVNNSNPMNGVMVVNGASAILKVNNVLTLGNTTTNSTAAAITSGILSVTNGTIYANKIAVGNFSTNINTITLSGATMVVTNTLATNASGLALLNLANSTLQLTVPTNGSLVGLVKTLNTTGTTNIIELAPATVIFASYPQVFPLIRYTTWTNGNNVGLVNPPAWAPGAMVVSNGANASLDLSLPHDPRPVFTSQPSPYSGSPGDNITSALAVTIDANSVQPLGYQWYYTNNGTATLLVDGPGQSGASTLTGSTSANLQIANAQTGDDGDYYVVVTNVYGTNTSSLALVTISGAAIPPQVTGPATQTTTNGVTTSIADSVSGSPVPTLRWQFNGVDLSDGPGPSGSSTVSGTASSTLTILNPQYPGDQGTYSLIAVNSAGKATNDTVLTVLVPPSISQQPTNLVVTNTASASFTVVASGVPDPTYQWYKGSLADPISSDSNSTATNATFVIASTAPTDTATYFVVVSNPAKSVTSSNATLTVNSTMSPTAMKPANNATGVSYDTPLYITFDFPPTVRAAGKIKIFNVTNSTIAVDTIDMSLGTLQGRTIAGEIFNTYPVITTGNTAAIYPHGGVLTSNQTYYVTIDDGVFADSDGAYFAGITATNAWQFTTKVTGPANPANLIVAQDYSGDFATVQGAIDSLPANNAGGAVINVHNGVYTEVVEFKKTNILVRGQSRNGTIIGYANNSSLNASTHTRMAMKVNANDIALDNLTVTNSTAQDFSQAEAIMIESGAARIIVNNCNVDSYQDTILANISTSKAYFNNSLIQGDVDFIWGGGNLFFTNCEVRWMIRAGNGGALGPNPSPSASDISSNGFSFVNCYLTTLPGATSSDQIGRTRGITNGNTALINCFVSTNIGGWNADALPTANFRNWFYGCTNDLGAPAALSNGIPLSVSDPNLANASSATIWLYGWQPQLSPNILTNPANQTITAGATATFSVLATGIPDPTYQWQVNGTNIDGATNASLIIPGTTADNAGPYSVIVTTSAGTVTSAPATLTVNPNTPPVFTAPPNGAIFTTNVGVNIAINVTATDSDLPGQTLTYTLLSGPTNAALNTASGLFTWQPVVGQADSTNAISVVATDNGLPNLSATNSFTIVVNPLTLPSMGGSSAGVVNGQFTFSVDGQVGPTYTIQASSNLLGGWTTLYTTNPTTMPFSVTDTNELSPQLFYRILVGP